VLCTLPTASPHGGAFCSARAGATGGRCHQSAQSWRCSTALAATATARTTAAGICGDRGPTGPGCGIPVWRRRRWAWQKRRIRTHRGGPLPPTDRRASSRAQSARSGPQRPCWRNTDQPVASGRSRSRIPPSSCWRPPWPGHDSRTRSATGWCGCSGAGWATPWWSVSWRSTRSGPAMLASRSHTCTSSFAGGVREKGDGGSEDTNSTESSGRHSFLPGLPMSM